MELSQNSEVRVLRGKAFKDLVWNLDYCKIFILQLSTPQVLDHGVLYFCNHLKSPQIQGRGETLFVQQGYFQPARLVNDTIELVPDEQTDRTNVIDDIIDEMIEINLQYGGDSVFLSADELKNYQGLVLTTRY